jgi:FdhD protein
MSRSRSEPPPALAETTERHPTHVFDPSGELARPDDLAVEEPLEIRVLFERAGRRERAAVAVTMRTPGADFELAVGFLLTEGILPEASAVARVGYCQGGPPEASGNVVEVTLAPGVEFDAERHRRNVYTTSSCGICGKTSLDSVRIACATLPAGRPRIARSTVHSLPGRLAGIQPAFARTGGIHAAALFSAAGDMRLVREDVGRHNAVDKVVGSLALAGSLPASAGVLVVSGRASFELVQKAAIAGIPILVAVGAASSLAAETATEVGMTLVGFVRPERFVVYAGRQRIDDAPLA